MNTNSYYKKYETLKIFQNKPLHGAHLKPIHSSIQLLLFYLAVLSHYKTYVILQNSKTKPLEGVQPETKTFNSRTGSILH